MEEILASIRRIISEDDQPAAAPPPAAAPAPPPPITPTLVHPAPEPEPEIAPLEDEEEVLELNEPMPPPMEMAAPPPAPHETHGDLDVFEMPTAPEPAPPPLHPAASAFAALDDDYDEEGLVSGSAASAVASHFGALAHSIGMPAVGRTLEDVVKELLRPLLKEWLDQHLPGMVEQAVRDEVDRISRRRPY